MKRKICFITAAPATVDAFLKQHILVLAGDFDITVVTDLAGKKLALPDDVVQKDISISRRISILSDLKALAKLTSFISVAGFSKI